MVDSHLSSSPLFLLNRDCLHHLYFWVFETKGGNKRGVYEVVVFVCGSRFCYMVVVVQRLVGLRRICSGRKVVGVGCSGRGVLRVAKVLSC